MSYRPDVQFLLILEKTNGIEITIFLLHKNWKVNAVLR